MQDDLESQQTGQDITGATIEPTESLEPTSLSDPEEKPPFEDRPETIRYGEIVHAEALSLLRQYLPTAVPTEPTEIIFSIMPQNIGRYRGKHYISAEYLVISTNMLSYLNRSSELARASHEAYKQKNNRYMDLLDKECEKEDPDFDKLELDFWGPDDSRIKVPIFDKEPEDWEDPDRLLKGRAHYSQDTWRGIQIMIHELIHQKQAELYPESLPDLDSEELSGENMDSLKKSEKYGLLLRAHRARTNSLDNSTIFYPAIEGMAMFGDYYVMRCLETELRASGNEQSANLIATVIWDHLKGSLKKGEGDFHSPYHDNYRKGFKMMRALYKKFGLKGSPELLAKIDLSACQQIVEGSERYQQIIQDPSLLPGLENVRAA